MAIDAGTKLRRCDEWQIGVEVPWPLEVRLKELVGVADAADSPTTLKELVSSLILAAPEQGSELVGLIRAYRKAAVAEAGVHAEADMPYLQAPLVYAEDDPPDAESYQIYPEDPLDLTPAARLGLWVAAPLSVRLDVLLERANAADERTSRKEIMAALILDAPTSPEALVDAINRFRGATVAGAIIEGEEAARFLDPVPPGRGPRPRSRRVDRRRDPRRRRG